MEWTVPFRHRNRSKKKKIFLGPSSKINFAIKIHDFNYANKSITTEEADKQFYEDTKDTSLLGAARVLRKLPEIVTEVYQNQKS